MPGVLDHVQHERPVGTLHVLQDHPPVGRSSCLCIYVYTSYLHKAARFKLLHNYNYRKKSLVMKVIIVCMNVQVNHNSTQTHRKPQNSFLKTKRLTMIERRTAGVCGGHHGEPRAGGLHPPLHLRGWRRRHHQGAAM